MRSTALSPLVWLNNAKTDEWPLALQTGNISDRGKTKVVLWGEACQRGSRSEWQARRWREHISTVVSGLTVSGGWNFGAVAGSGGGSCLLKMGVAKACWEC